MTSWTNKRLGAIVFAALFTVAGSLPVGQAGNSDITITRSDFAIPRDEVLQHIATLESMAAASNHTADYARAFRQLQDDLGQAQPPVKDWDSSDRDRLESLPEPSDAAWKALALEERRIREKAQLKTEAIQHEWEIVQQKRRDEERANAQADRAEQEAELQEARIEELEARADYYDDASSYRNNWWWGSGHRWRPNPNLSWQPNRIRREGIRPWKPGPVVPHMPPLRK